MYPEWTESRVDTWSAQFFRRYELPVAEDVKHEVNTV